MRTTITRISGSGILLLTLILFVGYVTFPDPLFDDPTSTVLTDTQGRLMNAMIADDGQWRFSSIDEIPKKYETALLQYEDQYFYYHPGVNPVSVIRAFFQNVSAGEIVSGASTLSMQVIRLARRQQSRTITEKLKEMTYALILEFTHTKKEILSLYASYAPFGGNVVGLSAASWRYFNRPPHQLSWAEAATLAVLPNQPALIYPGRNDSLLQKKRDGLLKKIYEHESAEISSETFRLALLESTPARPKKLPNLAPHLLTRAIKDGRKGQTIQTTVDGDLQRRANRVVKDHFKTLRANNIHNAGVLIADLHSGNVLAYVGNTPGSLSEPGDGYDVDVITAPRSSGSILKPLLYMWMFNQGDLLPNMLVEDIPINYSGYSPENYNKTYHGAVPASQALAQSLNVPAVQLLSRFGVPKFYSHLKRMGITSLHAPPGHYGLSLILGGAEVTLWDLVGMYRSLAQTQHQTPDFKHGTTDLKSIEVRYQTNDNSNTAESATNQKVDMGAAWAVLEAMKEVKRPGAEFYWKQFSSTRPVSWKTGTSFGHRDAWAVGVTGDYVIGVWVGNADGEGRPGLTGVTKAAPILFDMVNLLPRHSGFIKPVYAMEKAPVCRQSGHLAGRYCTTVDTVWIPKAGIETTSCPYHKRIYLNHKETKRVHSKCGSLADARPANWFELPPAQAWYYQRRHPEYRPVPEFAAECKSEVSASKGVHILYPYPQAEIYLPNDIDGNREEVVFEALHSNDEATLFWHVDETFINKTTFDHKLALQLAPGSYRLTVMDEQGNRAERQFDILRE